VLVMAMPYIAFLVLKNMSKRQKRKTHES